MTNSLFAAVDFGLTNTKVVARGDDREARAMLPTRLPVTEATLRSALLACGTNFEELSALAVTGSQHGRLPARIGKLSCLHVNEADAAGRGALVLSGKNRALVVSSGTGTAMIAARPEACKHVFGTAVGGGTLQGLGRLTLGTGDYAEIDDLASAGNPAGADLTIVDAIGARLNHLPEDMTAVNLGKVGRGMATSREDLAASLVTLVAQTISLIAISTSRAEKLEPILFVGNLLEMHSVRVACERVAALYGTQFAFVTDGGWAGATGALHALNL